MTNAEYIEIQARYRDLTKRQAELEVQIKLNQHDATALASLRADYRQVTNEISGILINNINQSTINGTH